jgi:fatty acid desaturase
MALTEVSLLEGEEMEKKDTTISQNTRAITALIRSTGRDVEKRHPFLASDHMGFVIWSLSIASIITSCYFYSTDSISPIAVVAICAFATSMLHELEHDLIHNLHSRAYPLLQHFMFAGILVSKMHASPWFRKELHLQHHQKSGQDDDAEERLIGLGLPVGLKRALITCHPCGSSVLSHGMGREVSWYKPIEAAKSNGATYTLFIMTSKLAMLLYVLSELIGIEQAKPYWDAISVAVYGMLIPNTIRQASLHLMSNTSHYYGNVPPKGKGIMLQNQILDVTNVFAWPAQLLCCGFGATHMLHHLVPQQNFVTRTIVFFKIRTQLPGLGVKINDIGAAPRANRHHEGTSPSSEKAQGIAWLVFCQTLGILMFPIWDTWISFHIVFEVGERVIKVIRRRRAGGSKKTA